MENLFSFALSVQVILGLLAPPIPWGARLVFPADVFALLWVPVFSVALALRLRGKEKRRFLLLLGAAAAVILVVFVHGAMRPSALLKELLYPIGVTVYETPASEYEFQFFRELVVACRLISWIWAALVVQFWPGQAKPFLSQPKRAFLIALALCTFSIWAAEIIPGVPDFLGRIYGYNPRHPTWAERAYGVFRSPVEGGSVLGLSLLLLVTFRGWIESALPGFLVLGALFMTRSITSVVAIGVGGGLLLASGRDPRRIRLVAAAFAAALGAAWTLKETPFAAAKIANFLYRIKPWLAYWKIALSRWDYFLLGTGFQSFYVDNIFVFLFNRGGLLFLGAFLALCLGYARKHWASWSYMQRLLFLFPFLAGISTDSFIIRPFAMLFFCLAVPALRAPPRA